MNTTGKTPFIIEVETEAPQRGRDSPYLTRESVEPGPLLPSPGVVSTLPTPPLVSNVKASVGPGSREPCRPCIGYREPGSPPGPPTLGCVWLSRCHRPPLQLGRGVHVCGWVALEGDFRGVGIIMRSCILRAYTFVPTLQRRKVRPGEVKSLA